MSKKLNILLALVVVTSMLLAACGGAAATATEAVVEPTTAPVEPTVAPTEAPTEAATEAPTEAATEAPTEVAIDGTGFKICQVTDTGGIDDKSFNATAWLGVENAITDFGIEGKYLESQQQTDYEKNIQAFIDESCNLIVTVGFLLGDATKAAAEANPDVNFAIVDYAYDPTIPNVLGLTFQTDQAAFLAGYAAAALSKTGKVGTFGGLQIPTVTIFMDGFYMGVQYYNEENGTAVEVLGWDPAAQTGLFTGNFESTDDGRSMGESLMQEGADVIMPVAGPVGLGTAQAIKDAGNAWIVGVDTDWTVSAPDYADIVLTSVVKRMDVTVQDATKQIIDGSFAGGVYVGTLENGGVSMAPVTNAEVSADLQAKLDTLQAGIIDGSIQTSPTPAQ